MKTGSATPSESADPIPYKQKDIAMSDYSSLTKAGLLERIGVLSERLAAHEKANASQPGVAVAPPPVLEAVALQGCIRALDPLIEAVKRASSGNNFGYSQSVVFPLQSDVERILRLLAAKYGVRLVDVHQQPCQRQHLDSIDAPSLLAALEQIAS